MTQDAEAPKQAHTIVAHESRDDFMLDLKQHEEAQWCVVSAWHTGDAYGALLKWRVDPTRPASENECVLFAWPYSACSPTELSPFDDRWDICGYWFVNSHNECLARRRTLHDDGFRTIRDFGAIHCEYRSIVIDTAADALSEIDRWQQEGYEVDLLMTNDSLACYELVVRRILSTIADES